MKSTIFTTMLLAVTTLVASANAQSYWDHNDRWLDISARYNTPVVQHHASTFEEGLLRGTADLVRSAGEYEYYSSLGMINREEARSRYMDNQQKHVLNFFEMRRINREETAYERGPRITPSQIEAIAKARAPQRLEEYEYEPAFGRVFWPAALLDVRFEEDTAQIDQLISRRGDGSDSHDQRIEELAGRLAAKLKAQISDVNPNDYVAAKNFLVRLQYEMNFDASPAGLATN